MIDWLQEFYNSADLRATLLGSLSPLFARYARAIWRGDKGVGDPPAGFVDALTAAYVDHHLASSRIQLQEVLKDAPDPLAALEGRLAEWAEKRPSKVAANETVRTGNAVALEQMRSEGVVTKVWATQGSKSCPYCRALDGTAVEITRSFFTPSDSFQPEGAETPLTFTTEIGGPPVHQGCVCTVVPG